MAKLGTSSTYHAQIYKKDAADPVQGGDPTFNGSDDATFAHSNAAEFQLHENQLCLQAQVTAIIQGDLGTDPDAYQTPATPGILARALRPDHLGAAIIPGERMNVILTGPTTASGKPTAVTGSYPNVTVDGSATTIRYTFADGYNANGAKDWYKEFTGTTVIDISLLPVGQYHLFVAEYDSGTDTLSHSVIQYPDQTGGPVPNWQVAHAAPAAGERGVYINTHERVVYKADAVPAWVASLIIPLALVSHDGASVITVKPFSYREIFEYQDFLSPGTISMHGSTTAPTGWLVCDGTSYSTDAYWRLHEVIGYTFGGSGGSFNVPDLRDFLVKGLPAGRTIGDTENGDLNPSSNDAVNKAFPFIIKT